MLGKRETLENDNDKPTKYSKLSINDNLKDIIVCKSSTLTIICSSFGSISINEDRNLFSFGKNESGCLGQDSMDKIINPPTQIPQLKQIKMMDCGQYHTACIDFNGSLFSFGGNSKGQLGIGKDKYDLPFTYQPQKINIASPVDYISCGFYFTICISNERIIYSFGDNSCGQLGLGKDSKSKCFLPQLIPNFNDIKFVQCGGYHTICETYANDYYSWGHNGLGQLGQGTHKPCNIPHKCLNWPEDIIDIKGGDYHTLLLTSTGLLYSIGDNEYGKLGLNENIEAIHTPTLVKDIPLIKRIECGYNHSMCIDINDNLWVFGYNEYGQLGLGDKKERFKPTLNESLHDIIDISSRGNHTFIKTINNDIYAFGHNIFSQIFVQKSTRYQLTPLKVFTDNEAIWATNIKKSKQKSARK